MLTKKQKINNNQNIPKLFTGKFEIILMQNALVIPQIRNAKFDWEYFIPHVGLFRISSALKKTKIKNYFFLFN